MDLEVAAVGAALEFVVGFAWALEAAEMSLDPLVALEMVP